MKSADGKAKEYTRRHSRIRQKVKMFEKALTDIYYYYHGYRVSDRHGIQYHALTCDPSKLLKSKTPAAVKSLAHEALSSPGLWSLCEIVLKH
jgi:hypothetical protein